MRLPLYQLYKKTWGSLDWLFPPSCGGCIRNGARWCKDCQARTQIIPETICTRCGKVMWIKSLCEDCRARPPQYYQLRSWAIFEGPLRTAIHRLKYRGDLALGEVLSQPLIEMQKTHKWEIDMIVPVPLGVARQSSRGYNQAALLALPLALSLGIKYQPKALKRISETSSQVGLSFSQRRDNVSDAFQVGSEKVQDLTILMVDDVTTSGATMEECSHTLINKGAKRVYGITLAR
jgi:ComF family protein